MSDFIKMDYRWMHSTIVRFKRLYPNLIKRGISYEPYEKDSMIVRIPTVGKLIYEKIDDRVTWLEFWEDEKLIKQQEKERRPEMYERFRVEVYHYIRNNCMTFQEFADMVGISRRSISRYLNGDAIPKVSTMKRICKIIHIDI